MSHDRIAPEVEARYGFRPSVRRLTGENENYLVKRADGARFVLRLIAGKRCRERILLEHAMVEAALEAGIAVALPRLIPDLHGNLMFAVGGKGCEPRLGRLMAYVPGVSWRNEPPDCQELLTSLGGLAARFATALSSVDLPAARRTHRWDLAEAGAHRSDLVIAGGPDQYRLLAAQFERWAAYRREMAEVPWGLIHGDLNDDNVLTADGRISHVLDFSDSLYNPLVCELAIALTYAMFYESEPWGAAAPVVGGYHAYRPLSATEIELLHPLVCGRLAASVVISAKRRQIDPARKGWFVTEDQAWAFLEKHGDHDPVEIADRLSELIDVRPYADRGAPAAVLLDRRRRVLSAAQSISYRRPVKFVRGRGAYLIDGRGRPFLDLHNNVCHVGHCHPRVVRAGQEQMARLSTNTRYLTDAHVSFSQRLAGLFPPYLDTVFLVNSGTEANELALRLACTHTGHEDVLVVENAYHGHTRRLVEISPYKFMGPGGKGRPEPWVHVAPMPDGFRGPHRGHTEGVGRAYGAEVGAIIRAAVRPIAAFLAGTLPSCGGQVIPPTGYFESVFASVRSAGGVCILDEVQVGFGRVGSRFWAFQDYDVVPDIVVLGKPMGNGHPIGAVVCTRAVAESFEAMGMEWFSTFGGNPVSCAI